MEWHPQTPPTPRVLTPNTPEYYASQIPGAFPEDNVVLSSPVVSGRKRKRDEYEEDDEESLNTNRHKKLCSGIYNFIGGFFTGLYRGQEATQGERPPVARRLGGSIHNGTAAASHTASTFVINSSYQIVRIVGERRRNARRAHRARNPLPEIQQSPFRRAIVAREGLHIQEARPFNYTTRVHSVEQSTDTWIDIYTEAEAERDRANIGSAFAEATISARTGNIHLLEPLSRYPSHRRGDSSLNQDLSILCPIDEESEPATPRQAITPEHTSDESIGNTTEADSSASTPEIVDTEFITVKAGPTCRILDYDSAKQERHHSSAKKERHIKIRSEAANPFHNMPRLTPPRETSPKRVKTPVQKKMRTLPPCNPLESFLPQIGPHGIQLPTPPDSPTTQLTSTQLMEDLYQSMGDQWMGYESDSDVSSTVYPSWQPPPTLRIQITSNNSDEMTPTTPTTPTPRSTNMPTAAQPSSGENAEGNSRPDSEPNTNNITTVRTPASRRRVRFRTRSYVQTPESEISSTCNASPGPTPHLETPTADRVQIDGQSHPDQKQSDNTSAIDATPDPIPKLETPNLETPITPSASAKGKAPESRDSEISFTCDVTPSPTPQLPTLNQLEHDLASQLNITPTQPITPKSDRHSSEKIGRTTRAQKRTQDLLDDSKKYTLAPLSAEQQEKVQEAVRNGHGKLSATDLKRVVPQDGGHGTSAWLNDEAINAYLELVVAFGKRNDREGQATPSHHAFNSYFYSNLSTRGPESIKRWATKAKIGGKKLLDTKYVFIPINHGMHWTLAVVSGQQKTITHYNSLPGGGGRHLRLVEEWVKSELGSAYSSEAWRVASGESPQQSNSDDCGVFTVTNARQLMLGLGGQFAAAQIPLQRQRMVAELVAGELVKGEE